MSQARQRVVNCQLNEDTCFSENVLNFSTFSSQDVETFKSDNYTYIIYITLLHLLSKLFCYYNRTFLRQL